jgi:hypothetical protein
MKTLYTKALLIMCIAYLPCTTLQAQINLTVINSPYSQNFNTLASTGTTNDVSTLPPGWTFLESGTNANITYAAGTGSSNTGNTYSFGSDTGDRALGGLLSGSLTPTVGATFVNTTGTAINELHIIYRGEQWRLGAAARTDRLDFQYSLTASSLSDGTWIDVDNLDFSSPNTTTTGALNGNDPINSILINYTITGLNIANNSTFFIRWTDFNAAGSDDGLSIDDFSVTAGGIPSDQPAITFVPAVINFGDVQLNNAVIASYQISGNHLNAEITAAVANNDLSLSLDSVTFSTSLILPDSGGTVFVRFAPSTSGQLNDTIIHASDSTIGIVSVNGSGFNQADNIIPIVEARAKSVGSIVTVAGRITVANELGNPAYLQDATGGIPVFDYPLAQTVEIGDSVIVTGPIGLFSNQKQISGTGIIFTLADSIDRIIDPKLITINELAAHEGQLVTVQNVELINKTFVFYPQSTEKIAGSGTEADLRIDGDTNIPGLTKPQSAVNITGVVGRFNTNAQLLPRFQADIPGAVEPVTSSDTISTHKTFDVVTWNLEFFGAKREDYPEEYGPADEALQLQNVKKVITTLHADIYGVEEISNDSLFNSLISQLDGYAATCSDRYSYSFDGPDSTFPPQKVCFIYDTTTVKIQSTRVLFESLYDSARTINPSLLPAYPGGTPSSFWSSGRLPYLITIEATINGVKEKINLIDIHAKSGATAADRNRRLYDAQVLKDSLDTHFVNEKVILVGDYNDDLDASITSGLATPYENFVNDTANYTPVTKALSDIGARSTVGFSDMIDHIIISNDLNEEYLQGSERVFTPFTLIPNYSNTTSDHLAVITRFAFQTTLLNFTEDAAQVSEDTLHYIVNLTASRPQPNDYPVTITLHGETSYGNDFQTTPAATGGKITVIIPAGKTAASFTISILDDTIDEAPEIAYFTIQPRNGTTPGSSSVFSLTLTDNDLVDISFRHLIASADEGSDPQRIRLKLSTPPATDEFVTFSVYNGLGVTKNDYTLEPAVHEDTVHVRIPAGSTEAFFTLTPLTDFKQEFKYETVIFGIQSVSPGLRIKNSRLTIFTIVDVRNVPPKFFIFPNPTFGLVKIICDQDEYNDDQIQATLRNSNGDVIYQGSGTLDAVSTALSNRLQSSRRGLFVVHLTFNGETSTHRLLKI